MAAAEAMGGSLPSLRSAADVDAMRSLVQAAAGKPVWVAPVDVASSVAAALSYTVGPSAGQMAALRLVSSSTVALVNVACGTEGVAVMQTDVASPASAPSSTTCTKQEVITPQGEACDYAVLNAAQPVSSSAAVAAAQALGKKVLSFASKAEYDAVRASLAGSYAAELLASGALPGLWVDFVGSAYRPAGYSLPGPGEASLLAGAALTPANAPVASTTAGVLVKKCSELDDSVGEYACVAAGQELRLLACMPTVPHCGAALCPQAPWRACPHLQARVRCPSSVTTRTAPPACLPAWTSPPPAAPLLPQPATRPWLPLTRWAAPCPCCAAALT